MTSGAGVSQEELERFLSARHGTRVAHVEQLRGGYWSSAFAYTAGGRSFVFRLGDLREGFEMDREAHRFARPNLPIPEVVEIGEAFGRWYAVSVRHHGRFLEEAPVDQARPAGAALARTLAALRSVEAPRGAACEWFPPGVDPRESTWRGWLAGALADDPSRSVTGWRSKLREVPALDELFERASSRVRDLLDGCPERRDLVHGDLLHQNVLLSDDWAEVTAVFSWKCSVRGDFLFDVAWCTFWSAWHPGVAAMDVWGRTLEASDLGEDDLEHAPQRHHCYEVQIGASHLGWYAWTGDDANLREAAKALDAILTRGPLTGPRR